MTPSPANRVADSTRPPDSADLVPALQPFYARAQDRWPGVLVTLEAFAARVARALEALDAAQPAPSQADLARCPMEDIYLAAALDAGAPRALELFHRENYDFIRAVSMRFALNAEDAEDVAQDLCATICERIAKYAGQGSLRGWLARVTPNVTRDHYRSGAEAWERSLEAISESQTPDAPSPESPLLSDEGAAADRMREEMDRSRCAEMFEKTLEEALSRLDGEDRELVRYRYFQGLKGREIARIRGVAEYVVSKRLSKILARMEKRIYMSATTRFGFSSAEVRGCLESLP